MLGFQCVYIDVLFSDHVEMLVLKSSHKLFFFGFKSRDCTVFLRHKIRDKLVLFSNEILLGKLMLVSECVHQLVLLSDEVLLLILENVHEFIFFNGKLGDSLVLFPHKP